MSNKRARKHLKSFLLVISIIALIKFFITGDFDALSTFLVALFPFVDDMIEDDEEEKE